MRDEADSQLAKREFTSDNEKTLTSSNGRPIDSITASMTAGPRGPIVLQDHNLLDHLAHFDRERIPERVVHAKGAGAFGYFDVTSSEITKYCKSKLFSFVGKRTPVGVRFSTVGGERGSADTARDPRGFAIKFYTEEGNWDLVGNATPIFFIGRDPILFPSFIHTQKRNPETHLKDPTAVWDFISLRPETTHQVSFLFSDRGTPDGYRYMNGYSGHAFKNVNSAGEAVYVKYHVKTNQGISNLPANVAASLSSSDPDYSIRDLYNAIANGNFPSWTLYIQVMSMEKAQKCSFNPFDVTKVWSHADCPLVEVGNLVLNRNPENYFSEVEQIAFSPANMIPGIEPSPDKMLQGRLFSYHDTHRHRLGPNYELLPVNRAFNCAVTTAHRDGPMRLDNNMGGAPNYFPNSFGGPRTDSSMAWHADMHPASTSSVLRVETRDDNFSQVGIFYRRVLDAEARERLTDNIAGHLIAVPEFIQKRAVANFSSADADYGKRIAEKLVILAKKKIQQPVERPFPFPLNPPRTVPLRGNL